MEGGTLNKMWCKHAKEYHSALKRKDGLAPATTRTTLEDIVLRETGQTKKGKYCAIHS